jgi:hypothetical protein
MPKMKISDLKNLDIRTTQLFDQEPDSTPIALHEAAHLVAAIAHGVQTTRVWVKTSKSSGRTILSRGDDGHAVVHPHDLHQDCFISLVGVAWEEQHGKCKKSLGDAQKFNFSRPWVLEEARDFVVQEELNIRACAAAILGLRDANGWLEGRRLDEMLQWLRPKIKRRKSLYESGVLKSDEPWVTDSPLRIIVETYLAYDDPPNANPRIRFLGPADIPLELSGREFLRYPVGTRLSLWVQLQRDENNDPFYKEVPGRKWSRVVEAKIHCTYKAPRGDALIAFLRKDLH